MRRIILIALTSIITSLAAYSLDKSYFHGIWLSATLVKEENETSGVSLSLAFMVTGERPDTASVVLKGYALFKGQAGAYFNLSSEALCHIDGDTLSLLPVRPFTVEVPDESIQYADSLGVEERTMYKNLFTKIADNMAEDINTPTYSTFYFDITVGDALPDRFTGTLTHPFGSSPSLFFKMQ